MRILTLRGKIQQARNISKLTLAPGTWCSYTVMRAVFCYSKKKSYGFTLIELLVVISIIGLLASIALVSLNSTRQKAKVAKTRADMAQFVKIVQVAQGESGKTLMQITGSGCSACSVCWGAGDLRNVPASNGCYTGWLNILTTVETSAAGMISGITKLSRDAWGSPYVVDENEKEFGPADCRLDSFCSAAEDGLAGTSDDICLDIPLTTKCP